MILMKRKIDDENKRHWCKNDESNGQLMKIDEVDKKTMRLMKNWWNWWKIDKIEEKSMKLLKKSSTVALPMLVLIILTQYVGTFRICSSNGYEIINKCFKNLNAASESVASEEE
jgi:hypothetical protein